jgi:hypothetical protein
MSESTADADEPRDDVTAALLDPSEGLDPDELDAADDDVYDPPEGWSEADKFGTTAHEAELGESAERKLAREEPDTGV